MLQVEGFVRKSDYYAGLSDSIEIYDPDWNDHYMVGTVYRDVELRFNVLAIGEQVEDATFDTAEPL